MRMSKHAKELQELRDRLDHREQVCARLSEELGEAKTEIDRMISEQRKREREAFAQTEEYNRSLLEIVSLKEQIRRLLQSLATSDDARLATAERLRVCGLMIDAVARDAL